MDKDIIFYSNFCAYCKEVLTKISKTPLNSKLTYICVDDQNIKLPPFVKAVPTIFLIKEQKILVDENIESWLFKYFVDFFQFFFSNSFFFCFFF